MKEKLNECFERLQRLKIDPTIDNMEILLQTIYDLREVYNKLGEDDEHGRPEADSERRNAD